MRPHLAFFTCSCASLKGFLVQALSSWHPILITLETAWHGRDFPRLLSHSVLTQPRERTKIPEPPVCPLSVSLIPSFFLFMPVEAPKPKHEVGDKEQERMGKASVVPTPCSPGLGGKGLPQLSTDGHIG